MRTMLMLLICVLATPLFAQQPADEEGHGNFRAVDIYVDSKGAPLAAYQLSFSMRMRKSQASRAGNIRPFASRRCTTRRPFNMSGSSSPPSTSFQHMNYRRGRLEWQPSTFKPRVMTP